MYVVLIKKKSVLKLGIVFAVHLLPMFQVSLASFKCKWGGNISRVRFYAITLLSDNRQHSCSYDFGSPR